MSSDFDALFTGDGGPREALLDVFAEAVTYTPKGAEAVETTADIEVQDDTLEDDDRGRRRVLRVHATVSLEDVASPGPEDAIAWGAETLIVTAVVEKGGGMATVEAVSSHRWEQSRQGWRKEL